MTNDARGSRRFFSVRLSMALLLALAATSSRSGAQGVSPIPPFDARRHVAVGEGVPGDYRPIEAQIDRLQQATSPSYQYYLVIVRSAGPKSSMATVDYTDRLLDDWRRQAEARGTPLDESRTTIVVVAIDNKQVAVHPPKTLGALGLKGDQINEALIKPSGFRDLAPSGRYPEAAAALLNEVDRWIVAHGAATRRTTSQPVAAVTPAPPVAAVTPAPPVAATGHNLMMGIGLSLLVIAAALLGGLWLFHRRTQGRLAQGIKQIRSRATDVMDRLDALKERLKLLPSTDPDFQTPMTGETAALYAKIQEDVGRLWDRWLQVMDSVDRAQKLTAGITSPFKRKALRDVEALLEQEDLFAEIDAGAKASTDEMDRLNRAHEAARGDLETLVAARPKLDAEVEAIGKLGLPIEPYREELAAIDAEADSARNLIAADPIGARSKLEALRVRCDSLIARAERIAGLSQESQKVAAALDGLKRQVAEHRSKGLRLDEDGGRPDESLASADQACAGAISALQAADPEAAEDALGRARSMVEQARGIVEQVRAARDYCRREQPERLRATERLRAALPHAEAEQQRLDREFAPGSWEGVRRNLDQVRDLIASFDRTAAEAAAASSEDAQRYLSGAAMLQQLAQKQQSALRLMSGIGERLNALVAARDDCRRRRTELEAVSRRVEGFFRQNDPIVGSMALDILDQARRGRDAVLGAIEQSRPDWPSIQDGLARATEGLKVAQDQAEVDVRSHRQLADEYERARAELERLADLLSSRREDRKAANQRFRSAAEVLDQVGLDLARPHGEWPRLLEQVRGAVGDLEQAERLAREDIRLAAQAQSEIEEAVRAIDQARGSFAMGVAADTSAAEAALARAEELLGGQQYEPAIECAGQAQMAARRAHQDAVQQASWRQMQADADRRRWEGGSGLGDALTTGAAVAAGVILGNVIQDAARAATPEPPSVPEPPSIPEPPPTETGGGSWETQTGGGSW